MYEPIVFDKLGKHVGHTLTVLPVLDKNDDAGVDEQRILHCEDCDETVLRVDNPELEVL